MKPFIVLEGCDGSGKTTLRELLRVELLRRGLPTITIGQHSWLHPWHARTLVNARERRAHISHEQLAAAYIADKKLHGARNVHPAREHTAVIADRWLYSDAVYHEVLYGIPAEATLERHSEAGTEIPDRIIYVRLDPQRAYERILKRAKQTRHYERPADLRRIVEGYERVFSRMLPGNPALFVVANGSDLAELERTVRDVLAPAIELAEKC
jgi:dTMP kinase